MHATRTLSFGALALVSAFGAACTVGGGSGGRCTTSDDCESGEQCFAGACVSWDAGPVSDAARCAEDETVCAAGSVVTCCGPLEVCRGGGCALDCRGLEECGDACCGTTEECRGGVCLPICSPERRCGEAGEACCAEEQACLRGACTALGDECRVSADCPEGQLCEPTLERCVPRDPSGECQYRPPVGVFSPELRCTWQPPAGDAFPTSNDVVMTPAVANLTDDNGDGRTDTDDTPDIVFVSEDREGDGCCSYRGVLRIATGPCDEFGRLRTIATVVGPWPDFGFDGWLDTSGGVAVGNLHPDTMLDERAPEIVAFIGGSVVGHGSGLAPETGIVAYRRVRPDGSEWEPLWVATGAHFERRAAYAGQPSIVDLDADGAPEVLIGNLVLDGLTGAVRWDGLVTVGAYAGVGNNAILGPVSTAADIDLDGVMEVIAGNTVYDGRHGALEWHFTYTTTSSECGGTSWPRRLACDGYNAIGNFDEDDQAEIVAVRQGQVFVLEHTGALLHVVDVPYEPRGPTVCGPVWRDGLERNEAGPPTVADFDGDGRAEIGVAGAAYYAVIDFDCVGTPLPEGCDSTNVLWKVANQDCSSRSTGSSVFDFDGDGRAEVIYADEDTFRIFDGTNGDVLFVAASHESNTRMEMPIVVDFDNDGKSEVIVPSPNIENPMLAGIQIWEDRDNNWVRTRRIWNQHTYHVTNVTEDGQIPRREAPNWLDPGLNNFRQNVQTDGVFDAPDLQVIAVELSCDSSGRLTVAATITNRGSLGVALGIPVFVRLTADTGETFEMGPAFTTRSLLSGQSEVVELSRDWPEGFPFASVTAEVVVDDNGAGRSEYNECNEDNNTATSAPFEILTCLPI